MLLLFSTMRWTREVANVWLVSIRKMGATSLLFNYKTDALATLDIERTTSVKVPLILPIFLELVQAKQINKIGHPHGVGSNENLILV